MDAYLNRFNLTTRLWLGTAVLWLSFGATLAVGLWGLNAAHGSLVAVHDTRLEMLHRLSELRELLQADTAELLRLMQHAPGSPTAALHDHPAQSHLDAVAGRRATADKLWADCLASGLSGQEKALADRAGAARAAWQARLDTTVARIGHGDYAAATIAAFLMAARTEGKAALERLAELQRFQEAAAAAEAAAAGRRYELALGLFIGCALLGALPATLAIGPTLRRQAGGLSAAQQTARDIADGDLARAIAADDAPDEVGRLSMALVAMQQRLRQTVVGVRSNAEQVASTSSQIAQGNQDLSQRTEQQASALQQTASAMEQLGTTVRHTADNAAQADRLSVAASDIARQGGQVVAEFVETMRGIDEASQKIADIIGVIDGIAFQTNILALNAAVEAARAGEQGRGFAVVAGEVRALAQRSAAAAREVKTLIGTSVERVEQGNVQAGRAGQTMQQVVASIRRVGDLVGEISRAAAEQSQGVAQTGLAVTQMDRATQQNAALVEQTAAAAESLRDQAGPLVQAVAAFRT